MFDLQNKLKLTYNALTSEKQQILQRGEEGATLYSGAVSIYVTVGCPSVRLSVPSIGSSSVV